MCLKNIACINLPSTMTVIIRSHFPSSFSIATAYFPLSFRMTFAMVIEVMHVMVSVLIRFGSGSFPPLNVHVTFGFGLAWKGISTTVDAPTFNVMVFSAKSFANLGGTETIKQ